MDLKKAWDLEVLKNELAGQGLPMAEVVAEKAAELLKEWISKSLVLSGPLYAAIGVPIVESAWPEIKKQIDKIDGLPG